MIALLTFLLRLLVLPSKREFRLKAKNAAIRQRLIILQCKVRGCVRLTNSDRLFIVLLYRWFPSILKTMTVKNVGSHDCPRRPFCGIANSPCTSEGGVLVQGDPHRRALLAPGTERLSRALPC
jgi:hypothetical protein